MNAITEKRMQMMKHEIRDEYYQSRIWNIVEAALEYFISIMVTGAFLARVTGYMGFSDSLTGVLSSFFSLGCLFQLGAIVVFRKMNRVKRPVLIMQGINQLLFATVYVCPIIPLSQTGKTILFFICFFGGYILMNLFRSPKGAWMISLVSDKERGIFSAKKEMVSLLGGMLFTYAMGGLIDAMEAAGKKDLAFLVGAVTILVLGIVHMGCMLQIKEKPREIKEKKSLLQEMKDLMKNKQLMQVMIIITLWNIAYYSSFPFYGAYQINELGFSMTFVSVLSIAYSIVRTLCSPTMGKLADRKSFSYMSYICFIFSFFSVLICCFTVPENGKILFTIHHCLHAVSMAGINSAQANMVYDHVKGDQRQNALAITMAFSGIVGFITTCLMSPVVDIIQKNGNQVFGMSMYAQQFVSAISCVLMIVLLIYMKKCVIGKQEQAKVI